MTRRDLVYDQITKWSQDVEPQTELIRRVVQIRLGGAAESILDRSPGSSGSAVYAVDMVTQPGHPR